MPKKKNSKCLSIIKLDDDYYKISKDENKVYQCKYEDVYDFSEGASCVLLNEKYGFID